MAKAEELKPLDADLLAHAEKVDDSWSPKMLTVLGFVSLFLGFALIVFMATRMTACMYLDGSR